MITHITDKELFNEVINLSTSIMCTGITNTQLKKFISLLDTFSTSEYHLQLILNSLIILLSSQVIHEVFVFTGKSNSGIRLIPKKALPQEGICFHTSLLIEHNTPHKQIIFKLLTAKGNFLELFLSRGCFNYQVSKVLIIDCE